METLLYVYWPAISIIQTALDEASERAKRRSCSLDCLRAPLEFSVHFSANNYCRLAVLPAEQTIQRWWWLFGRRRRHRKGRQPPTTTTRSPTVGPIRGLHWSRLNSSGGGVGLDFRLGSSDGIENNRTVGLIVAQSGLSFWALCSSRRDLNWAP